jgi:hypothetical protein
MAAGKCWATANMLLTDVYLPISIEWQSKLFYFCSLLKVVCRAFSNRRNFNMLNDATLYAAYVQRWFVDAATLADLSGCSQTDLQGLIEHKACPGPVYALCPDGTWWSAIGEYFDRHGSLPHRAEPFYTPGAAWWIRRAVLLERTGMSHSEISAKLEAIFVGQFIEALMVEDFAQQGFPTCFEGATLELAAAKAQASLEWADWINGGFAVCLHHFTGQSCVEKGALAVVMKERLEDDATSDDAFYDIELLERLSALMLPFAPWERADGTPGKTIDRFLANHSLGHAGSYAGLSKG